MLYKVTPMMAPPEKKAREASAPRKKRKTAIYDAEGNEVLITLMCLKCRSMKPLAQFGLRKMADGAIRNQPWCRTCRGGAGAAKPKDKVEHLEAPVETAVATLIEAPELDASPPEPLPIVAEAPPALSE